MRKAYSSFQKNYYQHTITFFLKLSFVDPEVTSINSSECYSCLFFIDGLNPPHLAFSGFVFHDYTCSTFYAWPFRSRLFLRVMLWIENFFFLKKLHFASIRSGYTSGNVTINFKTHHIMKTVVTFEDQLTSIVKLNTWKGFFLLLWALFKNRSPSPFSQFFSPNKIFLTFYPIFMTPHYRTKPHT